MSQASLVSSDDIWEEFPSREHTKSGSWVNGSELNSPSNKTNFTTTTTNTLINKELKDFLTNVKLDKYISDFIREGYEDINDLKLITFPDLMAMNIPRGHSRRLLEKLEVMNENVKKQNDTSDNTNLKSSIINSNNELVLAPGSLSKTSDSLNINILLLGDADVGKTSLRKRMELDKFVDTSSTIGVEMTPLFGKYQNNDLQVTVWDPAGQERYAPITKTFFRRAHGAAVVFSANEPLSWKSVEMWLEEIDTNAPDNIEIILICNKYDTIFNDKFDNNSNNSKLCDKMIKNAIEIARNRRIPFFMTSAKSGKCVRKSFSELVSLVLSNQTIVKKLYQERQNTKIKRSKNNKLIKNKNNKKSKSHKVLGIDDDDENNNNNNKLVKTNSFSQKWSQITSKMKKRNSSSSSSNSSWGIVSLSTITDRNTNNKTCSACKS